MLGSRAMGVLLGKWSWLLRARPGGKSASQGGTAVEGRAGGGGGEEIAVQGARHEQQQHRQTVRGDERQIEK